MADLNDDVLLNILRFCDVNTILAFSQAGRRYHHLSYSREVWFLCIDMLYQRGFIDLYPGQTLDQLTRDELVSLAKRTARGPSSWKKNCTPTASLSYTIKLDDRFAAFSRVDHRREAILVPGGQYLVFRYRNGNKLECWSLPDRQVIWTYKHPRPNFPVGGIAVDIVQTEDGPVIDILIGLRCMIDIWAPRKNLVQYLRVDPRTGLGRSVFLTDAVDTPNDEPFGTLTLSGDYALAYVGTELMLYNRASGIFTKHPLPSNRSFPQHQIGITRDHLVVMTRDPFWFTFSLKLHDLSLLQEQGSVPGTIANIDSSSVIFTTVLDFLPKDLKARDQRELTQEGAICHEISCHASPLHDNVWNIWVLMSAPYLRPSYGRIQKYCLEYFDNGLPVYLTQTLSIGPIERLHRLPMRTKGISWAGFVQENYADESHLYSLAEIGQPRFDLELDGRGVHSNMSPYSGTLTYTTPDEIVVKYFE